MGILFVLPLFFIYKQGVYHKATDTMYRCIVCLLGSCLVIIATIHSVSGYESARAIPENFPRNKSVLIQGVITEYPDKRPDKQYIIVETTTAQGQAISVRSRISAAQSVSYGDKVVLRGVLLQPKSFITDTGAIFDYRQYLLARSVVAEMQQARILSHEKNTTHTVRSLLYRAREYTESVVASAVSPDSYGLVMGVLIGSRAGLTAEDMDIFRQSGLSHIIVLSGFNISIIAIALEGLARGFGSSKRSTASLVIVSIGLFVVFSGGSPSIVRAGIMAGLLAFVGSNNVGYTSWRALLYAISIMIAYNPRIALYDIGFQLSASATLGIIYMLPVLKKTFSGITNRFELRETIATTVAAMIGTLPILIFVMRSFPALGIIANIVTVPLIPVYMAFSALTVSLYSIIPVAADIFGFVTDIITVCIRYVAQMSSIYTTNSILYNSLIALAILLVLYGGSVLLSSRKINKRGIPIKK